MSESMRLTLLIVVTTAGVGAGWMAGKAVLGNGAERAAIASERGASVAETSTPAVAETNTSADRKPDVLAVFNRIKTELAGDHLSEERAVKLFEELQDLPDDQFLSAIASLSSENNWLGTDAARLLIGYWAERDLPAARRWLLSLGEKVDVNYADAFFETWSRADLPGMYEWLETHADELGTKNHRDRGSYNAAKAAWRLDPERGIRLVKALDPEGGALWNLYNKWAEQDPKAAAARVLLETDAKILERTVAGLVSAWAPNDPAAAKAWAQSIPDPILSAKTVALVGSAIGWTDPRAGADFLAQLPQTNDTRANLKGTVGGWAERDLSAALGWAAGLQNAALGDWVATEVIANMPAKEREKAQQQWRDLREPKPAEKGR